jgi:hypothetical protein
MLTMRTVRTTHTAIITAHPNIRWRRRRRTTRSARMVSARASGFGSFTGCGIRDSLEARVGGAVGVAPGPVSGSAPGEVSGSAPGEVTGIGAVTGAMDEDAGYCLGGDVVDPVPFGVVRTLISL